MTTQLVSKDGRFNIKYLPNETEENNKRKYIDISENRLEIDINKICVNKENFGIFYNNIFKKCVIFYNRDSKKNMFKLQQHHNKAILLTKQNCHNSKKPKHEVFKDLYNIFIQSFNNINIYLIFSYFQLYYRTCIINTFFDIYQNSEYFDIKNLENFIKQQQLKEKYGIFLIEPNISHIRTLFKKYMNNKNQIENEKKQEELFKKYYKKMKEKQLKE